MSFGFDGEGYVDGQPVISNAISNALRCKNQRVLFFAAAANEGGNQPEMFPANHPGVISVRGTDDRGWLQRFNPPKGYAGLDCVMTLGQDVPGAGLSGGPPEVVKSGTSVSTSIAAGIAAMAMGYARLYEGEVAKMTRWVAELGTVTRMRAMLRMMSTEMDGRWYYLSAQEFARRSHRMRLGMIAEAVSGGSSDC